MIRNRRKLEAIVTNARRIEELESAHGGFQNSVKDLRKQFKFMGESGCYYFLHVVGEEVPSYEDWSAAHTR